jgi:hypothetical protein
MNSEDQNQSPETGVSMPLDPDAAEKRGVFHGFFGMTEQIPRARQAVDEACANLRKALAS